MYVHLMVYWLSRFFSLQWSCDWQCWLCSKTERMYICEWLFRDSNSRRRFVMFFFAFYWNIFLEHDIKNSCWPFVYKLFGNFAIFGQKGRSLLKSPSNINKIFQGCFSSTIQQNMLEAHISECWKLSGSVNCLMHSNLFNHVSAG